MSLEIKNTTQSTVNLNTISLFHDGKRAVLLDDTEATMNAINQIAQEIVTYEITLMTNYGMGCSFTSQIPIPQNIMGHETTSMALEHTTVRSSFSQFLASSVIFSSSEGVDLLPTCFDLLIDEGGSATNELLRVNKNDLLDVSQRLSALKLLLAGEMRKQLRSSDNAIAPSMLYSADLSLTLISQVSDRLLRLCENN